MVLGRFIHGMCRASSYQHNPADLQSREAEVNIRGTGGGMKASMLAFPDSNPSLGPEASSESWPPAIAVASLSQANCSLLPNAWMVEGRNQFLVSSMLWLAVETGSLGAGAGKPDQDTDSRQVMPLRQGHGMVSNEGAEGDQALTVAPLALHP